MRARTVRVFSKTGTRPIPGRYERKPLQQPVDLRPQGAAPDPTRVLFQLREGTRFVAPPARARSRPNAADGLVQPRGGGNRREATKEVESSRNNTKNSGQSESATGMAGSQIAHAGKGGNKVETGSRVAALGFQRRLAWTAGEAGPRISWLVWKLVFCQWSFPEERGRGGTKSLGGQAFNLIYN